MFIFSLILSLCVRVFDMGPHQDQLWGLLSRRLSRSSSLVDVSSVISILEDELNKPSMRSFNGKVILDVLRKYRDWKQHTKLNAPVRVESQR